MQMGLTTQDWIVCSDVDSRDTEKAVEIGTDLCHFEEKQQWLSPK